VGKGEKQQMFSFFVQKILDSASILWYNRRGFAAATQFVGPLRGRHHFRTSLSHFGAREHRFGTSLSHFGAGQVPRCAGLVVWGCAGEVIQ